MDGFVVICRVERLSCSGRCSHRTTSAAIAGDAQRHKRSTISNTTQSVDTACRLLYALAGEQVSGQPFLGRKCRMRHAWPLGHCHQGACVSCKPRLGVPHNPWPLHSAVPARCRRVAEGRASCSQSMGAGNTIRASMCVCRMSWCLHDGAFAIEASSTNLTLRAFSSCVAACLLVACRDV